MLTVGVVPPVEDVLPVPDTVVTTPVSPVPAPVNEVACITPGIPTLPLVSSAKNAVVFEPQPIIAGVIVFTGSDWVGNM